MPAFGFRRLLLIVLTSFALALGVSGQATAVSPEGSIASIPLPLGGWIGGRHYRNGDAFVYVLSGELAVEGE